LGAATGPGPATTGAFDIHSEARGLIARVKGILLAPGTEWPVIAAEASSASAIYLRYVAPLVAIGALATFIGSSLIGVHVPLLGSVRVPIVAGIGSALLGFVFSFLGVFVISWLVDVLAPTFGGQRDSMRALKVTAYSYTPAWVAGVLHILPFAGVGILAAIAGLYGLYLLYLGLPVLMRCPQDKSIGYTVILVLCAIVTSIVIGILSTCAVAGLGFAGIGAMSALAPKIDKVDANAEAAGALSNMFGGKTDADRARVSDALNQLQKMGEQAQKADRAAKPPGSPTAPGASANAVDMSTALNAVGQIMSGGKDVQPVDFRKLKDMLPESLAGMKRTEASGQSGEAMGMKGSSASASYSDGANANLHVDIADMGSLSGLASLAAKFDPNMEKETDAGYERTRKVNGQIEHERYDRRAKSGEISVIVANRFAVTVQGSGVEPSTLAGAVKEIDVAKLASIATK
jgi:Yip1 domain